MMLKLSYAHYFHSVNNSNRKKRPLKKIHGICFPVVLSYILVEDASDIGFPSGVPSLSERITS